MNCILNELNGKKILLIYTGNSFNHNYEDVVGKLRLSDFTDKHINKQMKSILILNGN